jgi:hypothetical protein
MRLKKNRAAKMLYLPPGISNGPPLRRISMFRAKGLRQGRINVKKTKNKKTTTKKHWIQKDSKTLCISWIEKLPGYTLNIIGITIQLG